MVATGALLIWPFVVMILFRRCRVPVALTWSIVGGYLLLPTRPDFNLPLLPTLDKYLIPSVAALVMVLYTQHRQPQPGRMNNLQDTVDSPILPGWIPRNNIVRAILLTTVIGAFMTAITNGDPLAYGPRYIPGLRLYDSFSAILTSLSWLLPFFLARKFLADPESHRTVLMILCVAGLVYTLPALYEIRMSPQLNRMVYGFFPGSWVQYIRSEGFRPLVFLLHGLRLGIFFTVAILAGLAYFRTTQNSKRWLYLGAAFWIFLTLALSKTLGALLIAMILIPVVLTAGVRLQLMAAAILAVIVISFPILRGSGLVPVDQLTSFAEQINPARAQSLAFRFRNEDIRLDKANERPAFGWGGWGRARVYNEDGRDISITDGRWVITIGRSGWAGYLGEFGLLTIPIILMALRRRKYEITLVTSGLAIVLAANLVDLIPNSPLTPVTLLMAGALVGRLELQRIESTQKAVVAEPEVVRTSRYSRPRPVAPTPPPVPEKAGGTVTARKRLAYTRQPIKTKT